MSFFELRDIQGTALISGIHIKAIYGENCSVSFLELPPFSRIPTHHHGNEQIGIVIEGDLEYTIGNETRLCQDGTTFVIPPHTPHSGIVVSKQPVRLIDIFTPPREVSETSQVIQRNGDRK